MMKRWTRTSSGVCRRSGLSKNKHLHGARRRDADSIPIDMLLDLQHLIDAMPGLVWTALRDGQTEFFNRSWLDYTGWTTEQASNRGWIEAIHPDDHERVGETWRSRVVSGIFGAMQARIRRHDGAYRWYVCHAHPARDAEGNISRWIGTNVDCEDHVRGEEALLANYRDSSLIINTIPAHIYVLNTEGFVQYVNQAVTDYTGLTVEDVQQEDYRDRVIHPEDFARVRAVRTASLKVAAQFSTEQRVLNKDGQYRWFLVRYNPLLDKQGRIVRWYVAAFDIEDRKRAEKELGELKDQLYKENLVLRDEVDRTSMFEEIVGTSPALQPVLARIAKVAPTDSTTLITGETGTGKELVARAIHRRSRRSARAFVSVNCAAVPRELIASELFGHEKGAFTGALQRRLGRFELATQGTIFLDEVGELPAETQVALLRVLQEREFERVGGSVAIPADVRVIVATNRDLEVEIAAGRFRSDLFYRLNVFPLPVPPLRDRKQDIPLLVEYFLDRYAKKAGKTFEAVSHKSLELLESYPWPGNIRELQNVIERSVIVNDTKTFTVDESWLSRQPQIRQPSSPRPFSQRLVGQEKEMIEAALRECGGRVSGPSGAAQKLSMPGSTLESKIKALKINKNRFKV